MRHASSGAGAGRGIGLDVGHAAVSLVDVQGDHLLRWSTTPLPAGAVASGAVRDVAAVADGVRRVLSAAGAGGQWVISGVSGSACFIRRMQFPDLPPKDLQRAVRWEAERLLPYPFEEAAVDYDILIRRSEHGKTFTDVVLVGARAEIVDTLRTAIESGGARLLALDAVPLARLRACRGDITAPGVLLAHLGTERTELTASDEYGLVFTRTVATGFPFDDTRHSSVGDSLDVAPPFDAAQGVPRPVRGASGARTLLEEVGRSVRFFEAQAGTQIARILLTGRGAEDPRAAVMFAAADLPPAVIVDPLAGLQREAALTPPPGLRLAAAAGLAMRAAGASAPKETSWR